jgi:YD repeat-containing protein
VVTKIKQYESTGVVRTVVDGMGRTVTAPTSTQSYSLPTTITPGGNAGLQTSVSYDGAGRVTGATGPNGDMTTTGFDAFGGRAECRRRMGR